MKLNLPTIVMAAGLFFQCSALAEAEQVPKDRKITEIRAYRNAIFVVFTPAFEFAQDCPNGGNVTISIETEADTGQELYTAALAAASQNLTVGFGVNGCYLDRPKAYRIDIQYPSD